jgi:polysaccharide export outer membrane protein
MLRIRSRSASGSAGSAAARGLAATALLLAASGTGAWAEPLDPPGGAEATAGIRIGLPPDARVSVETTEDRVALELPREADYPADFAAASQGLLRESLLETSGERVRLELDVTAGQLHRVEFEPEALVLHFKSSYALVGGARDGEDEYMLGADDIVRLVVFNHDDLTKVVQISRDGTVTLAHIGEVRAAGLSPRELAARIADRLSRIIVTPRVAVEVEQYRSQWVTVSGEVRRNGRVPLKGGTKLKEVFGETEGFTEAAGEEIKISRTLPNGETRLLVIDRKDYESGLKNPLLQHGDIVEVARADYCYIQGEVEQPGRVRIERGMTLLRALSLAGGLTDWADRTEVRVRDAQGSEEIYNLKKVIHGRLDDPPLRGGEVVIVSRRFL